MGLDLYIEARVREKKTGRIISSDTYDEYAEDADKGFFEICWWCSRDFSDIRSKMIEISNRYGGTNAADADLVIPVPQAALRDIYAYLVSRACLSDDECREAASCETEWEERLFSREKVNLRNADKLHDLLWILHLIERSNEFWYADILKGHIPDADDLRSMEEDPQAYEWEFRIFNSY